MFLGMSGKNESSTSCEDMVLRVELPGISGASGKQITCCQAILQSSCVMDFGGYAFLAYDQFFFHANVISILFPFHPTISVNFQSLTLMLSQPTSSLIMQDSKYRSSSIAMRFGGIAVYICSLF